MPLRQLAANYHDRAAALAAADHLLEILDHEVGFVDQSKYVKSDYCIELIEVSKHYRQRRVLEKINLRIQAGEKLVLVGETGAGKSTLLNLLLGFESPSSGQVLINGCTPTRETAAQQLCWLGQRTTVFYGSIIDNISFVRSGHCPAAGDRSGAGGWRHVVCGNAGTRIGHADR
nr:ATP-binding cassette domain-containing protein [Methylomarinum sp. Ch1-1]MDP4520041.1 ATP-binding cassette domain-containing protein [Methylomarinum sp. Ch1-1]